MTSAEMDKLVSGLETKLKKQFQVFVRRLRDENNLAELTAKIARGDMAGLIAGVEEAVEQFATDVTAGYVRSGQSAARMLSTELGTPVKFNIANDDALEWIEDTQRALVRDLIADQRALADAVLIDGRIRGLTDQQIAEELRSVLGMNAEQYKHVASYRRALESKNYTNAINRSLSDARSNRSLRALRDSGGTLSPERIERMVGRYKDRWLASRAKTIALSEANAATQAGVYELWGQAIDRGDFDEEDVIRVWVTRADPKVRHSHRTMHGQKRAMKDAFKSGYGNLLRFPCDPNAPTSEVVNCRCVLRMTLKKRRLRIRRR